jgi:hypothetical protein
VLNALLNRPMDLIRLVALAPLLLFSPLLSARSLIAAPAFGAGIVALPTAMD